MIGRLALDLVAYFVEKIIDIDVVLHAGQALAFWGTIALRKTLEWRRFGGYSVFGESIVKFMAVSFGREFFFWKWLKKSWPFYFFRTQNNYFENGKPSTSSFSHRKHGEVRKLGPWNF